MPSESNTGTSGTAVTGASVAEKVDRSLPPVDINLISGKENPEHQPQALTPEVERALRGSSKRPRRAKPEPEEIDLDPKYLNDSHAMNYALLLALLMREGGRVQLTNSDLTSTDTEHNVLFTLSLDRTKLEVSVVSSESGIIRSPEAKWAPRDLLPQSMPAIQPGELQNFLEQQAEAAQRGGIQPSHGQVVSMPLPQESIGPRIAEHPQQPPNAAAQGRAPESRVPILPFTMGDSPQTAVPMNLEALTKELQRDQRVAMQESRAAERVEQGTR